MDQVVQSDSKIGLSVIIVVLVVLFVGCLVTCFTYRSCERWRRKLEKAREKQHLLARLKKNWSELLDSEWVDDLSKMPEEWKSGIVPVRSETGAALNKQLQSIAKQIITISTRPQCCGGHRRHARLLSLKTKLQELIDKEIAPFFASRDDMYRRQLICVPKSGPSTKSDKKSVTQKTTKRKRSRANQKERMSEGQRPWPTNSNELLRQIMLLLRDLDNMFKASYNQRYDLRILHEDRKAYAEWMEHQLPQLMPEKIVMAQSTPHLFELYRQAAQVHSYYNTVCARIAKQTKALWYPAPLKKIFRILEKAKHVQRDDSVFFDCTRIFDIVRGTLIYRKLGDEPGGVLCGIRALFDCTQLEIVRVKDRFNNPTSACWRDALFNARMVSSQGTIDSHIVEIQLHQWDLREERMNVGGHFIYERHRALFEACEKAYGSEASLKLKDLHDHYKPVQAPRKDSVVEKAIRVFSQTRVHPAP